MFINKISSFGKLKYFPMKIAFWSLNCIFFIQRHSYLYRLPYRYVYSRIVLGHSSKLQIMRKFSPISVKCKFVSNFCFQQFTFAYVGPFNRKESPQYYKCLVHFLEDLVIESPGNGVHELWSKKQPKLQAQIMKWEECFNHEGDMEVLAYVQITPTLPLPKCIWIINLA